MVVDVGGDRDRVAAQVGARPGKGGGVNVGEAHRVGVGTGGQAGREGEGRVGGGTCSDIGHTGEGEVVAGNHIPHG